MPLGVFFYLVGMLIANTLRHTAMVSGAGSCVCVMVDPRRIELLSENPFTGPSSWVVYDLEFPPDVGHRQSTSIGSPFLHDRYKCELPMHVHHCLTPQPWPWYSSARRAALSRGTALRQPVRRFRQRLILR